MLRTSSLIVASLLACLTVGQGQKQQQLRRELIVGGVEAGDQPEFPYFALLEGDFTCGGVLIAPNRVLTAGTCVKDNFPSTVRVGATTRSNGQQVKVQCSNRHPKYELRHDPYTVIADLAVLHLETNVTEYAPVALNGNIYYPNERDQFLHTMGFGVTASLSTSHKLMKLETTLRKLDDCASVYPQTVIQDRQHLCANIPGGGGCSGDQGSPLVDGSGRLVGVLSFAYGCASSLHYDVATHAGAYYSWIRDQIKNSQCPTLGGEEEAPTPAPTPCVGGLPTSNNGLVGRIRDSAGALRGTVLQYLRPQVYNTKVEEAPWEIPPTR